MFIVDLSVDGTVWEEYVTDGCWAAIEAMAENMYEQGFYVNVWDETDRLVWRDGRYATPKVLSPFEREWAERVARSVGAL